MKKSVYIPLKTKTLSKFVWWRELETQEHNWRNMIINPEVSHRPAVQELGTWKGHSHKVDQNNYTKNKGISRTSVIVEKR